MTEKRSYRRLLVMAGVAALAGVIANAVPAGAEGPAAGSDCAPDQLDNTATAPDGGAIRCVVDEQGAIHWLPDTQAVQTVANLQSTGYSVTIDRIGDHPLQDCTVLEVHNPMVTTSRNSGGTTPGGPGSSGNKHSTTIVVSKTIDVSLDCTGV